MYKRMLVPLDGSKLGEIALIYARELAGRLDIDSILLHVYSPEESETASIYRAYVEQAAETLRHELIAFQKKTSVQLEGKALETRGELAVGHPAEEILRYADENEIDFIIMATHGRSGIRRWALGSVADKVLRTSSVPVLLVRAGTPEEIVYDGWPTCTMLVALDGSKLAESSLPHVEALAKQRGDAKVDVVLLRVCEPPVSPSHRSPDMFLSWDDYVRQEVARCERVSLHYLSNIEKHLKNVGISVRSKVLVGRAADEIIDYASRNPHNLIVMSTHGDSGVSRWAYGSIADKVLQGASSPIFLVRRHILNSD